MVRRLEQFQILRVQMLLMLWHVGQLFQIVLGICRVSEQTVREFLRYEYLHSRASHLTDWSR